MIVSREEKTQKIVEAAARVFSQKGYASATIAHIAKESGIGKGTVYEYFSSKQDLFFAVFCWYSDQMEEKAMVSIANLTGTVREKMFALSDAAMKAGVEMINTFGLTMEFWAAAGNTEGKERLPQAMKQSYDAFRELINQLVLEGIDSGEFRESVDSLSIATALVACWDGVLLQAWFYDSIDPILVSREFLNVVMDGLCVVTE